MTELEPLKMSDAEAGFNINKGLLEIERGHVSNHLSAIQITRGGTYNLATGEIDIYVVGIILKFVNSTLQHIPLVKRLVSFKDKLVRLHVHGNMSQPTGPLISKEPLTDISEGFMEPITVIAENGGKLADGVLAIVGSTFGAEKSQ